MFCNLNLYTPSLCFIKTREKNMSLISLTRFVTLAYLKMTYKVIISLFLYYQVGNKCVFTLKTR